MKTVFPYQERIDFDAYLDKYLQREDAIRRIPGEAELKELARKGVVKDHLVLAPLPEGARAEEGDTLTLRTVSELPKFNKDRVTVTIGRGLYDKGLEEALVGKAAGETCQVLVKEKPVTATVLEIKRKIAPEPTDEMVEAMGEKDYRGNLIRTCAEYEKFICAGKTYEAVGHVGYFMMGELIKDYPLTEYREEDLKALGNLERVSFHKLYLEEQGIDICKLTKEEAQELWHCDSFDGFIAMRHEWYKSKVHQCLILLNILGLPCAGRTDPLDHYEVLGELTELFYDKIRAGLVRRNAQ